MMMAPCSSGRCAMCAEPYARRVWATLVLLLALSGPQAGQQVQAAEAPPGVNAEVMQINTQTNAIAFDIPVRNEQPAGEVVTEPEPRVTPEEAMIGPYPSPEATKQLIDDAKALRELAEQRQAVLDEL